MKCAQPAISRQVAVESGEEKSDSNHAVVKLQPIINPVPLCKAELCRASLGLDRFGHGWQRYDVDL